MVVESFELSHIYAKKIELTLQSDMCVIRNFDGSAFDVLRTKRFVKVEMCEVWCMNVCDAHFGTSLSSLTNELTMKRLRGAMGKNSVILFHCHSLCKMALCL